MILEHKHSKTKIFIFLIFALVSIVFITDLVRMVRQGINEIETGSRNVICSDFKYNVKDITYTGDILTFMVESSDYDTNITRINILTDINQTSSENTLIKGGDAQIFKFEDMHIKDNIMIYPNDCDGFMKTLTIK